MTRPVPACAGTATPDDDPFFDPARGEDVARYCAGCPVTTCLADALARGETDGWWQGTWLGLPADPMVVAEPARVRVTVASRHGSRGRYANGCRCESCTAANTAYAQHYRHEGPAVTRAAEINPFEQLAIGATA